MKIRKNSLLAGSILLSLAFGISDAYAIDNATHVFTPVVQATNAEQKAELSKVKSPSEVKKDNSGFDNKPAFTATSAQDAINAFLAEGMPGCAQINFPSGVGFVSTGISTYNFMKNKTATAIAQRNAYVKAYTQAKKELAATLHGFSSVGLTAFAEQMETFTSADKSLTNTKSQLAEGTAEIVEGMIRGYVVYNVQDTHENGFGTVSVTIVTTPKTMGNFKRPDLNSISAASIQDGLKHIMVEVEQGIVPPVGGKTISVPQTGELAYVAFGSAIVHENTNPAVQKKQYLNAMKVAQMRARSSLLGVLTGDDIKAVSAESEHMQEVVKEYEAVTKTDPISKKETKAYQQLQAQKETFQNTTTFTEAITSLRNGIVPAGVSVRAIPNKEKTLITGVAIYMPSMTAQAVKAVDQMNHHTPMSSQNQPSRSKTSLFNKFMDGDAPTQGPSGRVSNASDL